MSKAAEVVNTKTQNPEKGIESVTGKYHDSVENLPKGECFQESVMPKGADPSPFKNLGAPARRGR